MGELLQQNKNKPAEYLQPESTGKIVEEQLMDRLEKALGRIAYSLEKKKAFDRQKMNRTAENENMESISASLDVLIAQIRTVLEHAEADLPIVSPGLKG